MNLKTLGRERRHSHKKVHIVTFQQMPLRKRANGFGVIKITRVVSRRWKEELQ